MELNVAISSSGPPQPMQLLPQLMQLLCLHRTKKSVFSNSHCFMLNLCPTDHRLEEANGELGKHIPISVKNPPEPPPPRSVSDHQHHLHRKDVNITNTLLVTINK